jgi:membrane protease YdiL (CAAX protease family)
VSVILSSLFFAYLNVKQPVELWNYDTPPSDVTWLDGLPIGFWAITGIVAKFNLVVFLNLALIGYVMTVIFMKSRSLWAAVGLHAGWATPILLLANIATHDLDKPSLWWGTYRLADGFFTTVCLCFVAFYVTRFYIPRKRTGFTF